MPLISHPIMELFRVMEYLIIVEKKPTLNYAVRKSHNSDYDEKMILFIMNILRDVVILESWNELLCIIFCLRA